MNQLGESAISFRTLGCLLSLLLNLNFDLNATGIKEYKLGVIAHVSKASVYVSEDHPAIRGVLLLCPGMNQNGVSLLRETEWVDFAKECSLGLAALHLVSDPDDLYDRDGKGYYYTRLGAGEAVANKLKEIYGKDEKVFMYGFSGGAQFGSRFLEQYSDMVASWALYSASFWPSPSIASETSPPGIVACGEYDATRFAPTYAYFQEGRNFGARWTWVSVENVGHSRSLKLERFIRSYFKDILTLEVPKGVWADSETKTVYSEIWGQQASLVSWFPSDEMLKQWNRLHRH